MFCHAGIFEKTCPASYIILTRRTRGRAWWPKSWYPDRWLLSVFETSYAYLDCVLLCRYFWKVLGYPASCISLIRRTRGRVWWRACRATVRTIGPPSGTSRTSSPSGPVAGFPLTFLIFYIPISGFKGTVVTNEKQGGVGQVADDRNWSQTVVIDVLFSFNLAAILD